MDNTKFEILERNLLDAMKKEIKDFNPYEDLNIFTILGMENKEVTAHSAFLYSVFKPFRDNGKINFDNLEILISYLLEKADKSVTENDIISAAIYREYQTKYGRLDFLIEYTTKDNCKNAIVIELKVWAGEQENQIDRYFEYLDNEQYSTSYVFFLTPMGYEASTDTIKKSIAISLKDDITKVLKLIKSNTEDKYSNYKAIIEQYIQVIKKLTGENYMNNILKSKEDIVAIGRLFNQRYVVLTELLETFMKDIFKKIEYKIGNSDIVKETYEPGAKVFVKYDLESYYNTGSKSFPRIAFQMDKNKLKTEKFSKIPEHVDMFFMVEIDYKLYCGITFRIKNKDGIWDWFNLKDYVEGGTNSCWIKEDWKHVKFDSQEIDFYNYEDEQNGVLNLLKPNTLEFDNLKLNSISEDIIDYFKIKAKEYFEN